MNTIKIFITHTPNKTNQIVELPVTCNVIAGADYQTEPINRDMELDNTGDNISSSNKRYCELTTQYWAWKNQNADYYGFCHYRRLFSFNEEKLRENGWGTISFSHLTQKNLEILKFDENHIRNVVEKNDFVIAAGINVKLLKAKTVADHYKKADHLNYKDFEMMMNIIKEKHPYLYESAINYANGTIFYPCNMFIMQKDLFFKYSDILFNILNEFEKRCDMSEYSVQGMRTTGHLGERIAGIYYTYIKSLNQYKTKELQIALFKDTEPLERATNLETIGCIPIVLAANNFYVPYMSVCIESILDTVEPTRNYEINILHTDITLENQKLITSQVKRCSNVEIKFIKIEQYIESYQLKAKDHITTETFYRFLILEIFKNYPKVIYLDCDLIVCHDLAALYEEKLEGDLMGAVNDVDFAGQLNSPWLRMREYEKKTLGLKDPFRYFQAGVLLFNVTEMRKRVSAEQLLDMAATGIYKYSDQDILNIICEGRVKYLDMSWNVINDCDGRRISEVASRAPASLFEQYMESRNHPYIIHYAGIQKPWKKASEDYGWQFWKIARTTPYYEQILERLYLNAGSNKKMQVFRPNDSGFTKKMGYYVFPIGTRRRELIKKIYYSIAK